MDEAMQEDILTTFPPPKLNIDDEHIDIQNVATNTIIEARVLLNDFQIHLTKHHKQFIRARFSNHTGTINAVIWDNNGEVDVNKPLLETYSVFDIKGKVTSFNNYKSITIISLSPWEEEINPFSLLPHTAHNLQSLTIELFAYLHELASPFKEISFAAMRSEEHTRELQSRGNLVCLLLPVEEKRDEEAGRGFAVVACEP